MSNIYLILLGSPADKSDLEVADEILEINGSNLINSTHTDVITHIHNVIFVFYIFYIYIESQKKLFILLLCDEKKSL